MSIWKEYSGNNIHANNISNGGNKMDTLKEKVAYLKGLAEGMDINNESDEGKIITKILDILNEMAYEIEDLQYAQDELEDYVDEMDEDLGEVEKAVFDEEDEEDEDEPLVIKCPGCEEEIEFFAEEIDDDGKIICPSCKKEIDITCDCSSCDDEGFDSKKIEE